jgi:hypothetical protein
MAGVTATVTSNCNGMGEPDFSDQEHSADSLDYKGLGSIILLVVYHTELGLEKNRDVLAPMLALDSWS